MNFSELAPEVFLEDFPEALLLEGPEGKVLDVNATACKLLGYEKNELLELRVKDIISAGEPIALSERIGKSPNLDYLEGTVLSGDGTEFPVELKTRSVDVGSEKAKLVCLNDISAQKDTESKLKTYLDNSPYGLLMVDDERRLLEVNDVACRLTGYARSELLGMTMLELFESEKPEAIEEKFRKLKEAGRIEAELAYRRKDGTKGNWSVSAIKLSEESYLGFVEDVTKRKKAELALLGERNKLRRLHDTVDRLQRMDDEDSILAAAIKAARDLLGFETCAVKLVEADSPVTESTSPNLQGEKIEELKSVNNLAEKTLSAGRTVWGKDFRDYPNANTAREDMKAYICVPIGQIGVILGFAPEAGRYERQDVELAEILAGHLREEIKRIRLEEALRRKAKSTESTKIKLEKLHDIAGKLESAGENDEIYRFAVTAAVDILGFSACNLGMAEGNSIVTKATAGELYPNGEESGTIDATLSDKTYRTGKTYVHRDIREIDDVEHSDSTYRSVISTPVGDIGALQVSSDRVGAFSDDDARLVKLLSRHVYEGLRRIELEKRLRKQAICDPLTGLYNRRYFTESLAKEIERSERYGHDITFIMFDVNRFKEINDLYSHQTGDRVLQAVANLIKNNVRNADTVVRYGGDEFLVMMPETSGNTENTVKRIRKKLVQWHDESDLLNFCPTLAVGFAQWNPFGGRKIEDTLREADRKMYEDKRRKE